MNVGSPPQQRGDSAPLWSFNNVRQIPGPGGTVVLHKSDNNRTMLVQPDVAEALALCAPFRSLDSHTKTVLSLLPSLSDHAEHTLQTLTNIAEAGLFESSEEAWNRLAENASPPTNGEQSRLFILTCDRPVALKRLLVGLAAMPLPPQIESVWVIDDSREATHVADNKLAIEEASRNFSVPMHHMDNAEQRRLINHILSELPETQSTLNWLLTHDKWGSAPTHGVARNFSLLLSIGCRALVVDDDVIPQAIAPPLSAASFSMGSANDREAVFYDSTAELDRHALPLAESPFLMMLRRLGAPLEQILHSEMTSHRSLAGWDGNLLSRHQSTSTALLSQCGSWGDSGTGGATGIVYLGDATVKRLMQLETPLEHVLGARAGWLGHRGATLTQYGTMSQLTGMDHRELLPPYLPAGRGEDILFGVMLQRLHPDSFVFNEGWAIRHAPLEDRQARGQILPLSVNAHINLLADWLGREPSDQWGLAPERRLAGLAEQIRRLSEMETEAVEALVREELIAKRASLLSRCMGHLSQVGSLGELPRTGEWRAFLETSRDQLVQAIHAPDTTPLGATMAKLGTNGLDELRAHGVTFAEALTHWPKICEVAAGFKA